MKTLQNEVKDKFFIRINDCSSIEFSFSKDFEDTWDFHTHVEYSKLSIDSLGNIVFEDGLKLIGKGMPDYNSNSTYSQYFEYEDKGKIVRFQATWDCVEGWESIDDETLVCDWDKFTIEEI